MPLSKEKRPEYMKDYYKNNPDKYEMHKLRCKLNQQKKRKGDKENGKI